MITTQEYKLLAIQGTIVTLNEILRNMPDGECKLLQHQIEEVRTLARALDVMTSTIDISIE